MPAYHPNLPPPPQPIKIYFDPFNSSATGHQRAGNRLSGSTSWRDSRTYKLAHQFKDISGRGGEQHISDLVGARSADFSKMGRKDNRDWGNGAPCLTKNGWQDIRSLMGGSRKRKDDSSSAEGNSGVIKRSRRGDSPEDLAQKTRFTHRDSLPITEGNDRPKGMKNVSQEQPRTASPTVQEPPQIFRSLVLYLNGSTAPLVSDHRLKQLWVQHGGTVSIALGRRTVTHVVLADNGGGGGGLASSKIQKEVARVRGKGVKYVSPRWVLDCIEEGKRLTEAGYGVVEGKVGGARQGSVNSMFGRIGRNP